MWWIKSLVMTLLLLGMLAFSGGVAQAGWYWNSAINVEGVDIRTRWTVDRGADPAAAYDYFAVIKGAVPEGVQPQIMAKADTETVATKAGSLLGCYSNGIDAYAQYSVAALDGADGTRVDVTVTADGQVVGRAWGRIGQTIGLRLFIPVSNPSCY